MLVQILDPSNIYNPLIEVEPILLLWNSFFNFNKKGTVCDAYLFTPSSMLVCNSFHLFILNQSKCNPSDGWIDIDQKDQILIMMFI